MFRDRSGPLYEFMKEIGRDMSDCGDQTPLDRFLRTVRDSWTPKAFGARNDKKAVWNDAGWIVAHLNELAESDFELLETFRGKFHVVHSPRSHDYFAHSAFAFKRLRDLGFNICLGTDSLASNEDLSLFAEMRAFQRYRPKVSPKEILEMVTVNPARALQQENALGRIQPGFHADLIRVPCTRSTSVFEEILNFNGSVDWMMIGGGSP